MNYVNSPLLIFYKEDFRQWGSYCPLRWDKSCVEHFVKQDY